MYDELFLKVIVGVSNDAIVWEKLGLINETRQMVKKMLKFSNTWRDRGLVSKDAYDEAIAYISNIPQGIKIRYGVSPESDKLNKTLT